MAEVPDLIASERIGVPHGFLTGPQSDRQELARVGGDLPTAFLRQVHSARALVVKTPFASCERAEADALVTNTKGLRLAIVTADCAPVLLADENAGVIGAAHAGWRGAHGGIIEAVVGAMESLGARASDIVAAIGPAIAQENYEVDENFRAQFNGDDDRFFRTGRPGHYHFALEPYVAARLSASGVENIDCLAIDTYANPGKFHSYRRSTHRGEPTDGRQISLIALPA